MNLVVEPSTLSGTVQAPASKSLTQRALAAALLKGGISVIIGAGQSSDERAARSIVQALGAEIREDGDEWIIDSRGILPVTSELNCGESGLAARMFVPVAALSAQELTITGAGSLMERPMDIFTRVLPKLNVKLQSRGGKLPMRIKGPLQPASIELEGSLSSQFVTGLILAFGGANAENCSIRVIRPSSVGYIDLTLEVMRKFGLPVPRNEGYSEYFFDRAQPALHSETTRYQVEGDWSGGAFLLVAGAIAGPILVRGLDLGSQQADRAILNVLMDAGAAIAVEAKGIRIQPTEMRAFEFDASDCPDLFPPLVALATCCEGTSSVAGVSRLIHKESNRAESLQSEFAKMGARISIYADEMRIEGGVLKGATISSHNDHRIAMASAVAAMRASKPVLIRDAAVVRKSYPAFFHDLKSLGAAVSLPFTA